MEILSYRTRGARPRGNRPKPIAPLGRSRSGGGVQLVPREAPPERVVQVLPRIAEQWPRVQRVEAHHADHVVDDDELRDSTRHVQDDITAADLHGGGEVTDVGVEDLVPHAGGSELELAGDRVLEGLDLLLARRGAAAGVAGVAHPIPLPVHDRHEQDDRQGDDAADGDGPRHRGVLLLVLADRAGHGPARDAVQHQVGAEADHEADDRTEEQRVAGELCELGPAEVAAPGESGGGSVHCETSVSVLLRGSNATKGLSYILA